MGDVIRVILTICSVITGIISVFCFLLLNDTDYIVYSMKPDKVCLREVQEFLGVTFPQDMEIQKITTTTPWYDGDSPVCVRIYSSLDRDGWGRILNDVWQIQSVVTGYPENVQCSWHQDGLWSDRGHLEITGRARAVGIYPRIVKNGLKDESSLDTAVMLRILFWTGTVVVIWLPYGRIWDRLTGYRKRQKEAADREWGL